jgi:hypothetical protein
MGASGITAATVRFLGHGGGVAWYLLAATLVVAGASTALAVDTLVVRRFERNVVRMVLEDDVALLDAVSGETARTQALLAEAAAAEPPKDSPYLVVSLDEHRVWLKQAGQVLFTTQVATGSGKTLVKEGGASVYKFETPRGRLTVQSKEKDPVWTPPDWHFVEQARKRGLQMTRLEPGASLAAGDGSVITTQGEDLVKQHPDGRREVLEATDGREIVSDGRLIVPPIGTNQRRYAGVLGTRRLNLGNGYALHGTNQPDSIGRSVSHGCIRLRNEDIVQLYDMVPLGTPVYIY